MSGLLLHRAVDACVKKHGMPASEVGYRSLMWVVVSLSTSLLLVWMEWREAVVGSGLLGSRETSRIYHMRGLLFELRGEKTHTPRYHKQYHLVYDMSFSDTFHQMRGRVSQSFRQIYSIPGLR